MCTYFPMTSQTSYTSSNRISSSAIADILALLLAVLNSYLPYDCQEFNLHPIIITKLEVREEMDAKCDKLNKFTPRDCQLSGTVHLV